MKLEVNVVGIPPNEMVGQTPALKAPSDGGQTQSDQAATPPPQSPPPQSRPQQTATPTPDFSASTPAPRQTTNPDEQHRLNFETYVRGIALLLVVAAIVTYPMFALIVRIQGPALTEAIAPITGIAGAIVGYWFGQASRRIPSVERVPSSGSGQPNK